MNRSNKLPGGQRDESTEFIASHTPLGFKIRSFIDYKVLTTIEDIDLFKAINEDQSDFIDDVIIELIDGGFIKIEEGAIKILETRKFTSAKLDYARKSLAEISKEIFNSGLRSRYNGDGDKNLDFGIIYTFPDEPEINKKAGEILVEFAQKMESIAVQDATLEKNTRVRAITFAGSVFESELGKKR